MSPARAAVLPALLLFGCLDKSADDSGGSTDSATIEAWLAAHNEARDAAAPTPDPALPDLSWDEGLARVALDWSAGCRFEHSMGETGENLAVANFDMPPADVVDAWFSEISDYDYASNTCADGKQCGHYTQLVWRDTTKVGCAVTECADVEGFGAGRLWVCEYDPPGNWVGEQPY
jgi:pathogenesis-related protein 1